MDITKEYLTEQYCVLEKSCAEIGILTGLYKGTIWKKLIKFDIPRRKAGWRGGWNKKELVDQCFGRLSIIRQVERKSKQCIIKWECLCDCGNIIIVSSNDLCSGHTQSCGCFAKEFHSNRMWQGYEEISRDYWGNIFRGAHQRNLEFNISIEYAWQLYIQQSRKCALSDLEIIFSRNRRKEPSTQTASLDRIDSSKGYVVGNVQWLHKDVNRMKQKFQEEYFKKICQLIADKTNK